MQGPELFFPELSPIEKICAVDDSEYKEELILVISINIGDGRTDQIQIFRHDDPEQLAIEFTHKHQLGARVKMVLEKEIEKYLKIAISRELAFNCLKANNKPHLEVSPFIPANTFTDVSMKVSKKILKSSLSIPKNNQLENPITYQIPKPSVIPFPYQPSNKINTRIPKTTHTSLLPSPEQVKYSKTKQNSIKKWPISGLSSNFKEIFQMEKKPKIDNSGKIMKKIKDKRYNEIFQSLSPNTYGTISAETVKKNKIPEKIQKILQPLLDELEEMKETLNFSEFSEAVDILMKNISPGDKSIILASEKKSTVRSDTSSFGQNEGFTGTDKPITCRSGRSSSLLNKGYYQKKKPVKENY